MNSKIDSQFHEEEWEDDDVFVDLDWITVQCSDLNAIAKSLSLRNTSAGTFNDFNQSSNTFIFPSQRKPDWSFIIHEWEPRGSSEEYLNAIEDILIILSQDFENAQSFASYENHIGYVHWVSSYKGNLMRSFSRATGTTLCRSFGKITDAENIVNWKEQDFLPGIGKVLKIARRWSVKPIFTDQIGDSLGILGSKTLNL